MLFTSEPQFQQLQKRNLKKNSYAFNRTWTPGSQSQSTKPLIRSGENLGDIFGCYLVCSSHLINCNVFSWQPNFFHSGDQLMILAHHGALIYFFLRFELEGWAYSKPNSNFGISVLYSILKWWCHYGFQFLTILILTQRTSERFPVAASHTFSVLSLTAVITCWSHRSHPTWYSKKWNISQCDY